MRPDPGSAWMIIPTYFPVVGGAQVQVQELSQVLTYMGWKVTVVTRQHSYAHPDGLPAVDTRGGVPVRRLYSRGSGKSGSALFVLSGLWFFLSSGRRSIYHAHDTGAAGWLAVAARYLLGGRCLVKLRTGRNAYERSLRSRLARWQFTALLRLADRVIVVNREVQEYLQELGIPSERVASIPNGVDTGRYCPAAAGQKLQTRARLGLAKNERVVLYVGRLEHMKGVDVLLRGWRALSSDLRRGSRLVLVGDGPERAALESMAVESGIADSVHFAGEQADIQPYYHAADLFVLPSRTEGLSNALLEAMACGLPGVVSRVGGAVDLVQDGQSGFFFPSEEAPALAARLEALLRDPAAWARAGSQARASVEAGASLAAAVQRTTAVYQELAESLGQSRTGFVSPQGDG